MSGAVLAGLVHRWLNTGATLEATDRKDVVRSAATTDREALASMPARQPR